MQRSYKRVTRNLGGLWRGVDCSGRERPSRTEDRRWVPGTMREGVRAQRRHTGNCQGCWTVRDGNDEGVLLYGKGTEESTEGTGERFRSGRQSERKCRD